MPIVTGRRHFADILAIPYNSSLAGTIRLFLLKTPVIGGDPTLRDDVPIPRYLYISYLSAS